MVVLSSTGEVADFLEADQFQPAKSQFECGFFACAMARSMAPVGHPPTLTAAQVIADAEIWYTQYDGSNAASNMDGMSLPQLYALLSQIGLHYQAIALDISVVKSWVRVGYPVVIAITETSVRDLALGEKNPYPWNPAGTHVILVTGVTSDGNVLVRDSANCTNLYDPNSLRPGPRHYDAAALQLVSATVVVPPWLPRPASALPPQEAPMPIPQGWHDDSQTGILTAPNGHTVVLGFRQVILGDPSWDPNNQPLEEEYHTDQVLLHNAAVGAGQRQTTRDDLLWYTSAKGVVREPYKGLELKAAYDEIAALKAQLAQAQQPTVSSTANIADAIAQIHTITVATGAALRDLGA